MKIGESAWIAFHARTRASPSRTPETVCQSTFGTSAQAAITVRSSGTSVSGATSTSSPGPREAEPDREREGTVDERAEVGAALAHPRSHGEPELPEQAREDRHREDDEHEGAAPGRGEEAALDHDEQQRDRRR